MNKRFRHASFFSQFSLIDNFILVWGGMGMGSDGDFGACLCAHYRG